jgi:hypothetical protein
VGEIGIARLWMAVHIMQLNALRSVGSKSISVQGRILAEGILSAFTENRGNAFERGAAFLVSMRGDDTVWSAGVSSDTLRGSDEARRNGPPVRAAGGPSCA